MRRSLDSSTPAPTLMFRSPDCGDSHAKRSGERKEVFFDIQARPVERASVVGGIAEEVSYGLATKRYSTRPVGIGQILVEMIRIRLVSLLSTPA